MQKERTSRVVIFGNIHRTNLQNELRLLVDFCNSREVTVLADSYLIDYLSNQLGISVTKSELISDNNFEADLVLSLGGDGTFLNSAARVGKKGIPILGINTGRLGFLADVSKQEMEGTLDDIFDHKYTIEERTMLTVESLGGVMLDTPYALNDVALSKQDSNSMIIINARHKGELINSYQADGLIVATPTGSTAYSMSVGGPIVHPAANNLLISPVASHSLNVRPLVVPDSWVIDLDVISRSNSFLISIDGRSQILDHSTRIRVQKSEHTIKVLRPTKHTFFNTLRKKLLWGVDRRNG